MKDRKVLFTAFAIFLLMGAAPLQAARVYEAEQAVQQHAIGTQQQANLALQAKWPFGGNCETLQENWVRLNNETAAPLTALQSGEELSFTAKVALALKVRGMFRTARRAANNECTWLGDSNVVNFEQRISELAAMSPCADTAREIIEEASDLDEEEQQEAMREAVQVLMSPTCELPEDDDEEFDDVEDDDDDTEEDETSEEEELAEENEEEDGVIEEVDELADELTEAVLVDPSGASFLQESEGQVETVIVGAFMALFFGLFFLLWLPFLVGAACFLTGLGFLVFSLVGCMLYNLLRLLTGRIPGGCPMFNWLPHCPQAFEVTIRSIWGDNVRVGGGGGYYGPGYGPGYVAPVVAPGVYYGRRRWGWNRGGRGGAVRQANRRANRANRRANQANRRANRANQRARRANRRARRSRMGRRMGRMGRR